jgi:hypothetical protein
MDGALPQPAQQMVDPTQVYWADAPAEELSGHLEMKRLEYKRALEMIGMPTVWRMAYAQEYGMDPARPGHMDAHSVGFSGEQQENIVFRINDFRSFVKQSIGLALGQRPSYRCLAVNDDYESLAQIEACDSALTYIANRAYGEDLEREKVEIAKIAGWAWDWHRWDADGGDEVPVQDPDSPLMGTAKSGMPTVTPKAPWDVTHDVSCRDGRHTWLIVDEWRSKWELAAEFPVNPLTGEEQSASLIALSGQDGQSSCLLSGSVTGEDFMATRSSDAVRVQHFYHARTKALPDGRYVGIAGGIVLWDVGLPMDEIPVVPFMPSRITGTSFGYSDAWDMLPLQQMIDQITSDRATNAALFGRPSYCMDEGTTMTVDLLARGGQLFTKKPGTEKPSTLDTPAMNAEPGILVNYLHSRMRENQGQNNVTRGGDDSNVKSGTHAALYHAMAVEYAGNDQQAVDASRTRNGNLMLESIKTNAQHPFMIEVSGESAAPYAEAFDADRFRSVKRVQVVTDSPMTRTMAGRLELFNATKDIPGAYSDVGQVIELLVSGQYKPTYQAGRRTKLGIRWENEKLARGEPVPAAQAGENFFEEVREHMALKRMPSIRNRPEVVALIDEHLLSHLNAYLMTAPPFAMAANMPPAQALGGGPPPPGGPGASTGGPMEGAGQMADAAQSEDVGGMGVPLPKPAKSPVAAHAAMAAE